MRSRLLLIIGIPLALGLIVAAVVLLPRSTSMAPHIQVTPTATTVRLPAQDVTRLEKALSNPDMKVQATVMAPELASAYLAQNKPGYPTGSTVKILQNTSVCRDGVCEVKAVVTQPNHKQTTFLLYLDNSTGTWLIISTSELR